MIVQRAMHIDLNPLWILLNLIAFNCIDLQNLHTEIFKFFSSIVSWKEIYWENSDCNLHLPSASIYRISIAPVSHQIHWALCVCHNPFSQNSSFNTGESGLKHTANTHFTFRIECACKNAESIKLNSNAINIKLRAVQALVHYQYKCIYARSHCTQCTIWLSKRFYFVYTDESSANSMIACNRLLCRALEF